jgi:hypothetical protein
VPYPLQIPRRFRSRLAKKTPPLQASILAAIKQLADNPRHPGLHSHKVRGRPGVWESYVDQANRLTWQWQGGTILLRNHCNHDIIAKSP